jgi:hypothetical protein
MSLIISYRKNCGIVIYIYFLYDFVFSLKTAFIAEGGGGRVSSRGRLETQPPLHSHGNQRLRLQFERAPDDGHYVERRLCD